MCAASPAPIMEPTTVGGRPKAASIMGAGEAANIAKAYANEYMCFAYLHILAILLYFPDAADADIPNWSAATLKQFDPPGNFIFSQRVHLHDDLHTATHI